MSRHCNKTLAWPLPLARQANVVFYQVASGSATGSVDAVRHNSDRGGEHAQDWPCFCVIRIGRHDLVTSVCAAGADATASSAHAAVAAAVARGQPYDQ